MKKIRKKEKKKEDIRQKKNVQGREKETQSERKKYQTINQINK